MGLSLGSLDQLWHYLELTLESVGLAASNYVTTWNTGISGNSANLGLTSKLNLEIIISHPQRGTTSFQCLFFYKQNRTILPFHSDLPELETVESFENSLHKFFRLMLNPPHGRSCREFSEHFERENQKCYHNFHSKMPFRAQPYLSLVYTKDFRGNS